MQSLTPSRIALVAWLWVAGAPLVTAAAPAPGAPAEGEAELDPVRPEAAGLFVEFGRGATFKSPGGDFALTLRGRVQTRASFSNARVVGDPDDISFQIRRARVVLLGDTPAQHVQLYIQLGFGARDLDLEREVPLRDAQVIWTGLRDASLRVGQMKVPFNRERLVSSSALQFADRSIVNAELNLDRDVGVQAFSNDLFGWGGRLVYLAGVYGGAGRNRTDQGTGLLYVARLQFNPLGPFKDVLSEADLLRSPRPRLAIGLAAGYHPQARRLRTTHGALFAEGPRSTTHGAVDLALKWAGWSLTGEVLARRTRQAEGDGPGASALGAMGALGHVFANRAELAVRWAHLRPLPGEPAEQSQVVAKHHLTAGVGYYFAGHNLKLQLDYDLGLAADPPAGEVWPRHEGRAQLQLFF